MQELIVMAIINIVIAASTLGLLYYILRMKIGETVDGFAEIIGSMLTEPTVKSAMSVLGKKSGESKRQTAVVNRVASDLLSTPQISGLKMAAKAVGIDIDSMIEEYGAVETLQGLKSLGDTLGIDLLSLTGKGLNLTTAGGNTAKNPYLG